MSCEIGNEARLWFEPGASTHTFDANSETFEFESHTLGKKETRTQAKGIRGDLRAYIDQDRITQIGVGGSIVFPATPYLHDHWLTRILGGTESTNVWTTDDVTTAFGILAKQFSNWFTYSDCVVTQASWRGSSGGLVTLTVDVLGKTESQAGSEPASLVQTFEYDTPATQVYRFADGVLTINSVAYAMEDFELTVANNVQARFANSLTASCLVATERVVTLRCRLAATSGIGLHSIGDVGHSGSLVFTNGAVSTAFAMPELVWPQDTPGVPGKGLLDYPITMMAKATGGGSPTAEITVTNDATV